MTPVLAQVEAAANYGAQQVLYTFNPSHQPFDEEAMFEECGAMNIFFLLRTVSAAGLESLD